MKYIPGLPHNPPTHLVELFHNKGMMDSVKKQINFVIGSLLNSIQNKAASLHPATLFFDHMEKERFNGQLTFDYLSKGIDYANFCVATKDLSNVRQGWPKLSDDFSVGMSAAFVLNNESIWQQIPEGLRVPIQNSAQAFLTELNAALNFSQNGSMNMQQYYQYPAQGMMPTQGVQQFPANGVQAFMNQPMQMMPQQGFGQPQMMQMPQVNQQQLLAFIQSNPQLMQAYQQNPQYAMQQAQNMLMQAQMQNPYMQRMNTMNPMVQQQTPMMQAPTHGFINNNQQFGVVQENQVGTARGSSFSKAPANTQPQQVQLNHGQNNNGMNQQNPQFQANQQQFQANTQPQFQPQPTAQQPSVSQQVTGATVVHGSGGNAQQVPVNMTQQMQPINNPGTVPQYATQQVAQPVAASDVYSNLADTVIDNPVDSGIVADKDMSYNVSGRRIGRIYCRDKEIVKVVQDQEGVVIIDKVEEATVKYDEHESQRVLPTRTRAEKRASASSTRMNQVLELAASDVSYNEVMAKIRKDQEDAGEELVDVDVSRVITELGTNAVRLEKATYALNKQAILPIIRSILNQQQMPVETTERSVITDVVLGGPLTITETVAAEIDKLNRTSNLNDYISQLEAISRIDIPNFQWAWIHDEVLREINNFLEKYYGLAITIDSVVMDLDELINYLAKNYDNDLSTQLYVTLHAMLTSTVLQVFRHDEWPDIVDEKQVLVGKVYRVVTLPIVSCQVPYNVAGKSGIIDRNSHTQLVKLLDGMMKWREDYHSMLLITVDNDIIEVNTTTLDGNYIMYCGNEE